MAEAIQANPNAKWKVAMWHQSVYSEGNHNTGSSLDDPIVMLRNTWPALMDKYGVDGVLMGHDHYYTRTAQMLGGNAIDPATGNAVTLQTKSNVAAPAAKNPNTTFAMKDYPNSVTNPKGTVYFTLDSGSGSKFYNFNTGSDADHTFSVVGWQGYVPSYSYISFSNSTFTISTYATSDFSTTNLIDSYTITKR
jgi:hypothetical protein